VVLLLPEEAILVPGVSAKNARLAAGVFVFAVAALGSGCATLVVPQTTALREAGPPAGLPAQVELDAVPFFPQDEYQCGPAALATVLAGAGVKITPLELVPQVYLPARQGSLQVEMLAAARRNGLVSYQLAPTYEALLREIAAGTPVIVLQNLGVFDGWHYAVAMGYDFKRGDLVLRSGETRRKVMDFAVHEFYWKRGAYWAMVAMPPGKIPATAEEARWLDALVAFEKQSNQQKNRINYTAFLQRWPRNTTAAIGLANAHHSLGELAEAEAVLRAAEPTPVVLNNLAQTLSDRGRHEEALQVIERAVAEPGKFLQAINETRATILQRLNAAKGAGPAPR
jgi:tetratricopeptide (TPR) repeat protein